MGAGGAGGGGMTAGGGAVAGIGVGSQGEPGVLPKDQPGGGKVVLGRFRRRKPNLIGGRKITEETNEKELIPGYTVKHKLGINNEHHYTVHHAGKEVGEARLSHTGKHVVDLGIDKEHRRKGLASALYNHIEKHLGYKLSPSPTYQTSVGKAFWSSRKITEESEHSHNPVEVNVYHGSGHHFTEFSQKHAKLPNDHMGGGIGYFTDHHDMAKSYAKARSKDAKTHTPYVYHTKLKMHNVFDVDHHFHGKKLTHILPDEKHHEHFARGAGLLPAGSDKYRVLAKLKTGDVKLTGHQVWKGLSHGNVDTAKARDHLVKKGYDGLRYNGGENIGGATKHNVYIPYNKNSIHINKVKKL